MDLLIQLCEPLLMSDTDEPEDSVTFEALSKLALFIANQDMQQISHIVNSTLKGARINSSIKDGKTALHLAATIGFYECVDFLIQQGANVNVTDSQGQTGMYYIPLLLAADVALPKLCIMQH